MLRLGAILALLALAGCATVPPKKLWSLDEDGGFVCKLEDGTACPDPSPQKKPAECVSAWCKTISVMGAAGEQWFNNMAPALEAIGKLKK